MGHRLIIGSTGTGKTYLAKKMVDDFINQKKRVVIFNPKNQNFNTNAERYGDPENFYQAVENSDSQMRCYMVIDELPIILAYDRQRFENFVTHARHYGSLLMLVQRPRVVLSPTVMSQVDDVIVFKLPILADRVFINANTGIDLQELEGLDKKDFNCLYKTL